MQIILKSNSSGQTEQIAYSIGSHLKGGEVIELSSDLGGGKTTFTRGLVKAIGGSNQVASPTFTISRLYHGQKLDVYHFDFYRLADAGLMSYELNDVMNPNTVVIIEWAGIVQEVLPKQRLKIEFDYTGQNTRSLIFTYPKSLSYLVSEYANNDH